MISLRTKILKILKVPINIHTIQSFFSSECSELFNGRFIRQILFICIFVQQEQTQKTIILYGKENSCDRGNRLYRFTYRS